MFSTLRVSATMHVFAQLMMFRERQQMVDAEHFNTLAQRYATPMV